MMMKTIKPSGVYVGESIIQYRYEREGKYYIVDKGFNKMEISQEDYMKLKCPIKKNIRESEVKKWVQ